MGTCADKCRHATSNKIDFVCCGGRNPDRLEVFSRETGLQSHADFEAVLADPDIDAVVLAIPNELHFPFAELAARRGKHAVLYRKADQPALWRTD